MKCNLILVCLAALLFTLGCGGGGSTPPPPLAVELIPGELQKAYSKAPPESKELVTQLTTALKDKDYTAAHLAVQALFNSPVATKEQRTVIARSMLTITTLLQNAQSQGDPNAAASLTRQKMLK